MGGAGAATSGMANSEGGESAAAGGVSGSTTGGSAGEGGSPNSDCIVRVAETGNDSDDGGNWERALATVQRGLDVAVELMDDLSCAAVEVWVAAGTYLPSSPNPLDARIATFRLVPQVALYGGFAGTETDRAARNIVANVTVLSGDVGTPGDQSDNAYHVVTGASEATLDGFTVTGGYANGFPPNNAGAGMDNEYASPTVTDCTFSGNYAVAGGGMFNGYSSPIVTGCTFADNGVIFGDGGGMYNYGSSPVVIGCVFSNNDAQYNGGAISSYYSAPRVDDCTFTGNGATTGGAVFDSQSSSVITNSTFAANDGYTGGALYVLGSSPSMTNDVFANNGAYEGGAIYNDASLALTNCTFFANSAHGTARFTGEAFASGGAIYNRTSSVLMVTNGTFYRNAAEYAGGGIYSEGTSLNVANSILWNDTTPSGVSEIAFFGSSSSVSSSIIQDGYPSGVNISTTDPVFRDPEIGNFQLSPISPAIDAGDSCAGDPTVTDQAGNGRWDIAAVPNSLDALDLGALEYQGTADTDTPVSINCF